MVRDAALIALVALGLIVGACVGEDSPGEAVDRVADSDASPSAGADSSSSEPAVDDPVPTPAAGDPVAGSGDEGQKQDSDANCDVADAVGTLGPGESSDEERELRRLRNRAVRELNAAGFDVGGGSFGHLLQVCDTVRLELADEVTLHVSGDVEGARQAIAELFPGEPIAVVRSERSLEEVSTAVPRVTDALADAEGAGRVPDGIQFLSIGGDVFGPADILVELVSIDRALLSDSEWAGLQPAVDALAAELSTTTGLDVRVERATVLPIED
jgi:hypothetical protein